MVRKLIWCALVVGAIGLFFVLSPVNPFLFVQDEIEKNPNSFLAQVPSDECSDGIDNDADGLVDWTYDLGCFNEDDPTEEALSREEENGWTTYDPSPDTRIVYVSNSEGNDTWTGLCPTVPSSGDCGPKQTTAAGMTLIRDGYPDWLLLKRGDTWRNEYFSGGTVWSESPNGRSSAERIVVASYGASQSRPILEQNSFQNFWNVSNVAIHDFEFYNYGKDILSEEFNATNNSGFRLLYANQNILIENNHLRFATFIVQSAGSEYFDNVELRRNVIEKNFSVGSHAQGIFSSTGAPNEFLIEDNVWDSNGWSDEFRFVLLSPNSDVEEWKTLSDARFDIELEETFYNIDALNFTGAMTMDDVASIIESRINTITGQPAGVDVEWTSIGHVLVFKSTIFQSDDGYSVRAYTGATPGTDIDGATWLNASEQGAPESTIFNRNMYLSYGYGTTILRGNIDANGASGGTQLRMGGIAENNLFLRNPHGLVYGHADNPVGTVTGGVIRNNVVLGSRDIDTQVQGSGIMADGIAIGDLSIYENIVAHNEFGTGNIKGLYITSVSPMANVEMYNNIVYDWGRPVWPNPDDTRGNAMIVNIPDDSSNVSVHDNVLQQTNGGFVVQTDTPEALNAQGVLSNNTYYSTSPNPTSLWSTGWFAIGNSVSESDWFTQTGDSNATLGLVSYPDPNRDIESYMASIGQTATYDAFMTKAKERSRFNDREEYTAEAVINYIRAGFGMDPITVSDEIPSFAETLVVSSGGGGSSSGGGGGSKKKKTTPILIATSTISAQGGEGDTPTLKYLLALLAQLQAQLAELLKAQGTPSVTTTYTFTRDLYVGIEGEDVRQLQKYLNRKGFSTASPITGAGGIGQESTYFGNRTQDALKLYQRANGIDPTGYFGAVTRGRVNGG